MKNIVLAALLITATSYVHPADLASIDALLAQAREPIDVKQQIKTTNAKLNTMLSKSKEDPKQLAERKRYFARLPEISKQLSELTEEQRKDEEIKELLTSTSSTLEYAKTSGDASEQAQINNLVEKQKATITLIEREEEKRREEEEKEKAAANVSRVINLNAPPASSRGIFAAGRFRQPVRRTANRR